MQLGMTPLTFQHPYLGVVMRNPNTTTIHKCPNELSIYLFVIKNHMWISSEKKYVNDCTRRKNLRRIRSRGNITGSEVRHALLAK